MDRITVVVGEMCDVLQGKETIFTFTDASFFTEVVPMGTFTLKAAKCINAVSTLAETRQFLAFINVYEERKKALFFWLMKCI